MLPQWFQRKKNAPPSPAAEPDLLPQPPWSVFQRIGFRFLFAYCVAYIFLPFIGEGPVLWVGRRVFHTEISTSPNGSGDTTYNYVQLFCFLCLAAVTALCWSVLDRKRTGYPHLAQWLRVGVRYWLALILIGYGAFKVIPAQFPAPDLDRLQETFGQVSPMGLLWTFMGASPAYSIFGGALEMACGFLLVNRRTTLLGSLLCAGVMGNVVALNFCYDVPVKQFSFHLLLAALYLIAPDVSRLIRFFFFGQAVSAAPLRPHFRRAWMNRVALGLRAVVVLGITGVALNLGRTTQQTRSAENRPVLYGIWRVQSFKRGDTAAKIDPWRRIVFSFPGRVGVYDERDNHDRFAIAPDKTATAASGILKLTRQTEPGWQARLTYQRKNDTLFLKGDWNGTPITVRLQREPEQAAPLLTRGFHWINEYPFNR